MSLASICRAIVTQDHYIAAAQMFYGPAIPQQRFMI